MIYEAENKDLSVIIKNIEIPVYQRNYVWDKHRKESLIESLILKYPVGVLTAYKNNGKYVILDGLQRMTTIKAFQKRPYKILSFQNLKRILKLNFTDLTTDPKTNKLIENFFKKWYESLENLEGVENDTADFQNEYGEYLQASIDITSLPRKEINEEYKKIIRSIKFLDIKIPIITCEEFSDNELTEVFEKMNTGSMKLSKYEVFVAQWDIYGRMEFSQHMGEVINADKNKRSKYLRETFDIITKDENKSKNNGYYLYEYFLAVSSLLQKKGFKKENDAYGYEIISLLLINKVYSVNKLVTGFFVHDENYDPKLVKFLENIYEIIETALNKITNDIKSEKEKFAKYFRLVNYINMNYIIDVNTFTINERKVEEWKMKQVMKLKHDFANERQVSYLQNQIANVKCNYLGEDSHKEKVSVLLLKLFENETEAETVEISIRPEFIKEDVTKGKYKEIAVEYKEKYFFIYMDNILQSKAIKRTYRFNKREMDRMSKFNNKRYKGTGIKEIIGKEAFDNSYVVYGDHS